MSYNAKLLVEADERDEKDRTERRRHTGYLNDALRLFHGYSGATLASGPRRSIAFWTLNTSSVATISQWTERPCAA
jgi:hypothetical protein